MKPDKLEKFVLDNRTAFDDVSPSSGNWEKIRNNIRPVRQIRLTTMLVRIAAVMAIFVSTYIFVDYTINKYSNDILQADDPGQEVYDNIPVLTEARAYYSGQISIMETEVYQLAGESSPIREEIKVEFDELDKIFEELKSDLRDDAANGEVIEAMIQHYRIKLQILEEILFQLKNADENNTDDHEEEKVFL